MAAGEGHNCDYARLIDQATKHGVLPLICDPLERLPVPEDLLQQARKRAQMTVRQNYRLLFLSRYLLAELHKRQIPTVLLKGMGTASYYPVPELRKSGDVDLLLLDPERVQEAGECLKALGCTVEEWQPALHHVVFGYQAGERRIETELHTMLAEPFDDARINQLLTRQVPQLPPHVVQAETIGVTLPVLDTAYHAYELLLHMLQHFLRAGFGLKLLCDWVVFWNRGADETQKTLYLALVREAGIKKFSDLVTLACVDNLGLRPEAVAFMEPDQTLSADAFMAEIMEAEEFGKSSRDRMVALRGSGVTDYVREFHHQMHLNYPKAGKVWLLWPVLWCLTLGRFLINNHTVRKTSLSAILKKAGQRGDLMKKLELFREER